MKFDNSSYYVHPDMCDVGDGCRTKRFRSLLIILAMGLFILLFCAVILDVNSTDANTYLQGDILYEKTSDTTVKVVRYHYQNDIIIPSWIEVSGNTYTVTSIDDSAFYDSKYMSSVIIPDSVTSIGNSVFAECTFMVSVTLGNGVLSIGDCAFQACESLTAIVLPDSVTSIGSSAFEGCMSLTSVTIPRSVTILSNHMFQGCKSLASIDTHKNIQYIGDSTFADCISLTAVSFSSSVISIGHDAFSGCIRLTSVFIYGSSNITKICDSSFKDCDNLQSIYVSSLKYYEYANAEYWSTMKGHLGVIFEMPITKIVLYLPSYGY